MMTVPAVSSAANSGGTGASSGTGGTSGSSGTATGALPSGQSLNNMFLQLLVAQLQHQDPTSPVDPSQFVGQLAQFSELSEVTSIYTLLQQVVPGVSASGSTGGSSGGASGGTQGSAGNATGGADVPANPSVASLPLVGSGANAAAPAASPNFSAPSLSDILSKLPSKIQGAF